MAIPSELSYRDEDDFDQQFLIPLLRRLGFSVVANYHGHAEFGKDLVFAEIDRFGHIRYHAVQSKYLPSISLNAVEELILDCRQAFNNPFTHPQSGAVERISTFYAINAGTLSPEATQHFFQSLMPIYGGNVRLLQAKDLLVLDQWATAARHERVIDQLTGLLLEVRFNRRQIEHIAVAYQQALDSGKPPLFFTSIRSDSIARYLSAPILPTEVSTNVIEGYWHACSVLDAWISVYRLRGVRMDENKEANLASFQIMSGRIESLGKMIESQVTAVIANLGPLTETNSVLTT